MDKGDIKDQKRKWKDERKKEKRRIKRTKGKEDEARKENWQCKKSQRTAKERRKEDRKPGRCSHDLVLPHPLRGRRLQHCSPLPYHLSAEWLQSCPTLCDPMEGSPLGSFVHGILQARIPEWVAVSSSRGSSRPRTESLSLMSPALADVSLPPVPLGKSIYSDIFLSQSHHSLHAPGAHRQGQLSEQLATAMPLYVLCKSHVYDTYLLSSVVISPAELLLDELFPMPFSTST